MSNIKQWVPNKVDGGKKSKNKTYPFDGSIITKNENNVFFAFSSPGLINGAFPENMWDQNKNLISLIVPPGDQKWFVVCECEFNVSLVRSTLKILKEEPTLQAPTVNSCPNKATIILWAGIGIRKAWKVCKGNILVKPMLILRNYKTDVPCGEIPFEDYYSIIGYS